ncbi:MAG: cohesin domain-containing protein [Thomasclavelia sp.]
MIITIIFSMCCGNILNVVAKENAIISVSNASGKLGEEVSLIINLSNLPDMGGIKLISLGLCHNDQLQLIDYEIGSLIDSSQEFTNKDYTRNPFKMSWGAGLTKCNLTDNGVAAILTFRILDTAAFGNTNVIVSGTKVILVI